MVVMVLSVTTPTNTPTTTTTITVFQERSHVLLSSVWSTGRDLVEGRGVLILLFSFSWMSVPSMTKRPAQTHRSCFGLYFQQALQRFLLNYMTQLSRPLCRLFYFPFSLFALIRAMRATKEHLSAECGLRMQQRPRHNTTISFVYGPDNLT